MDPYVYYARLRAEDPVHLNQDGVWVLTRYEDVALVLRDSRFGRKGFRELLENDADGSSGGGLAASMLFQDPPAHTRLRNLAGKAFTPRVIEGLRARIQQIVDELLDSAVKAGAMDVIADLAFPLPVCVICELIGVPACDRERFREWSIDIAMGRDEPAVHDAVADYFRHLIAERRKSPQADLLTGLIEAEAGQDGLSESELVDICGLLFVAGHETTVNLIGNGMLALLMHPAEMRKLREDPELLPGAIEELLRYESPVQRTGRMSNTDVEMGGKVIPRGAVVSAMLGAANRDPRRFVEPDRLDVTRRDNEHLAFGRGGRYCIGAALARIEGQAAIGSMLRRVPKMRMDTDRVEWRDSDEVRGLKGLRVRF